MSHHDESRLGAIYATAAFTTWGLVPLYFKLLVSVPAIEVLAHRIVWSLLLAAVIITWRRGWRAFHAALRNPRISGRLLLSAAFIAVNWGTYIWAIMHDRVLDASLGYYITPLVNVLMGTVLLREKLRRLQWLAVGLATVGTAVLAIKYGRLPWVSLVLAGCFGSYGLIRKTVPVPSLDGLGVEMLVLSLPSAAYLIWLAAQGSGHFISAGPGISLLLLGTSVLTTIPLLWFASGARRLKLSSLGFFQYIAPTIQFGLAITLFAEPLTPARMATFVCIWTALAIYSADNWRQQRRPAVTREAA